MNIERNEELGKSQNNIVNHERCIEVPRGWNRCLENGNIVYFSPTQICLRSKEDIARYLISDRTCKCGLDCPLYIDKVFDFDASIPSHHFKITKLENDHKTLCKETIKARFATLAQTQIVIKKETKGVVSKPVIIKKKKSEVSVSKKKNEAPKLPSFETFASLADGMPSQNLQEQSKPKKARKPASHKRKSNPNPTVTPAVPMLDPTTEMQICQTVHSNATPIFHSAVEMQKNATKDAMPQVPQYTSVSSGAVFGTSEYHSLNQNLGSLFTFPSTHLNASTFLASLSSAAPTIPVRAQSSRATELSHAQHPLLPYSAKSHVEHVPFGQKPVTAAFPVALNQPNNVVYLSSGLRSIPNQNSKVSWQGTPGIPLSRLPQEKPKGGFSLPKIVYPYPTQIPTAKSTMSYSSASPVTSFSKLQMKQHDLQQVLQKQQTSTTVKTTVAGRSEAVLPIPGYSGTIKSNTDKYNVRTATVGGTKPGEAINQPVQYCGILLQPGMVPQVQLAGAGARPTSAGACNSQSVEQNQYGGLYALQGIPYGGNVGAVGNPAVVGMTPNTIIPYFLGITQPGTIPKPIVPATTSMTKECSPTSSVAPTAPVSTSAISAAYSAFVSIAPASSTNGSFSQQLVNLVSNYSTPYWQHLLTQGANPNPLAYQLMPVNQSATTRPDLSNQTTKSSTVKNAVSARGQTKVTSSSSKSSRLSSQECKPKISAKDSLPVPTTSSAVITTVVTTEGDERKRTDCATSNLCSSNTIAKSVCTDRVRVTSTKDNSAETTSDKPCEDIRVKTNLIETVAQNSSEGMCNEVTNKEDNRAPSHQVSNDTLTEEVMQDNTNSVIVKTDLPIVNKDSVNEQENEQVVNSHTLGIENTVKSEHNSIMPECEKVETDNINKDCRIVTSDSKNYEEMTIKSDCSNNDKGNGTIVPEEDRESSCVIKKEPLDDTSQRETPMETEVLSSNLSNNQNCDQDFKVEDKKDIEKLTDNDVQNGVTESSMSNDTVSTGDVTNSEKEISECDAPAEFTIGDVVWAQARGLPSWPGKIVDESFAGRGKADNGKKWVMWFGDHTCSQVEVEKLKTLTDGLKTLDDKGRKRKYRGKKSRAGLEQAIGEALEELDQRERLRSRQGPKAKKRRL